MRPYFGPHEPIPPNLDCGGFHHAVPIYGIQNAEIPKKFLVTSSLRHSIKLILFVMNIVFIMLKTGRAQSMLNVGLR